MCGWRLMSVNHGRYTAHEDHARWIYLTTVLSMANDGKGEKNEK